MSKDILIVDDEADIREIVSGILQDEGYATRLAADGITALDMIRQRQPNLVILDVWLGHGERDGIKILETIKRDHPYVPVIMISGHSTIETAVSAIKKGAYDFIEKPFQTDRLLLVVERAIESARLRRENAELKIKARVTPTALLGNSHVIQQLKNSVDKIAASASRVFITGPRGCAKETIAREIHNRSSRANAPFFVVHCGALHPHKLEVELFGADIVNQDPSTPRKIGLLEEAFGGTIYFEEITQLPLPFQLKLVKVLHEQSFVRVGGIESIDIDIRFIGGTSEDVPTLIQNGDFREDLFYRLGVAQIKVPALCERVSDVPMIAQKLMEEAAAASGLKPAQFSEDVLVLLQSYSWPGDLVQLRNVIDGLLIKTSKNPHSVVSITDLPYEIMNGNSFQSTWQTKTSDIIVLPLREAREAFEREYLITQVNRFAGNISQTARFIGMERSALHRKLRALKIQDTASKDADDFSESDIETAAAG